MCGSGWAELGQGCWFSGVSGLCQGLILTQPLAWLCFLAVPREHGIANAVSWLALACPWLWGHPIQLQVTTSLKALREFGDSAFPAIAYSQCMGPISLCVLFPIYPFFNIPIVCVCVLLASPGPCCSYPVLLLRGAGLRPPPGCTSMAVVIGGLTS